MKLYLLRSQRNYGQFARFSHVGTWGNDNICQNCGQPTARLIEPLKIEWDPDTDVIGDFSWCGYTMVITDGVRKFLEDRQFECNFGVVEVVRPKIPSKRRRVPYPFTGPDLHWLMPTDYIELDEAASGVEMVSPHCPVCGQDNYKFKYQGIVVDKSAVQGRKIFMMKQFGRSSATYITEEFVPVIEFHNFSNFGYVEVGIIS